MGRKPRYVPDANNLTSLFLLHTVNTTHIRIVNTLLPLFFILQGTKYSQITCNLFVVCNPTTQTQRLN